jgi:histidinol-phosphate aminotransferase
MDPSFDVYSEIATVEGRVPVRIPLADPFELTLDQVRGRISDRTRVIFITRPNNPTSRIAPLNLLLEISRLAERAVIVSDEAYIEFADDYREQTAAPLVMERSNLIVTRTFSKAYGLANLRVGYALGRSEAIGYLLRIKPKWNVGDVAQQAAVGALLDTEHLERTLATVHAGRAFLIAEFNRLGLTVVPGAQANFVMAHVVATGHSAAEFTDLMGMHGVIIRGDFHPDYIRVSVGTAAENEAAIRAAALIVSDA